MIKYLVCAQIVSILVSCKQADPDPNTFSNYLDITLKHLHIEWLLNLNDKYINATALYDFKVAKQGLSQLFLDVYQLDILFVYLLPNSQVLDFKIEVIQDQSLIQGDRLKIILPNKYKVGETIQVKIKYNVDTRSQALSFLTKEQTGGKIQPYMFSQCEDIHCRSMIPLQDTPAVKHTYSASMISLPEIKVFMSGNQTQTNNQLIGSYENINDILDSNKYSITNFESKIPYQCYLIAIIAGDVVQQQVGKRSYVITEPMYIDSYAAELNQLEDYLTALETYIGPYLWGDYKIVIQPPSFPIGGMENPLLTFASPSIIVGDKSGVAVAVHEMAHSWNGNTVTCDNWSNFWINEGFTVFLERKASEELFGRDFVRINAYDGNSALNEDIAQFGENNSYSSLFPQTAGKSPGDSSSEIPYEKGFQFLYHLESFIGEQDFKMMLRAYMSRFQYQSINESDVRNFFSQWLEENKPTEEGSAAIEKLNNDWDSWVKQPGYPPIALDFMTDRITKAHELAQSYIDLGGLQPQNYKDFQSYLPNQKQVFLQYLTDFKANLNSAIIKGIEQDQKLNEYKDKEVLWRWFRACLQANYTGNIELVHKFLGEIGRKRMIVPVYTELNRVDHQRAVQYFNEYRNFYHPLAVQKIESILSQTLQDHSNQKILILEFDII